MAKSKPTEFSPAPAFEADDVEEATPAVDPRDAEIARLKAELAEKKVESDELAAAVDAAESKAAEQAKAAAEAKAKAAENAKAAAELKALQTAALESATPLKPVPTGPLRKFLVGVQHGPQWVVEAASEGDAANAYLTATGMISWVGRPEIREAGPNVPLGRFEG